MKPKELAEMAKKLIDLALDGNYVRFYVSDANEDGKDYRVRLEDIKIEDGKVRIWFNRNNPVEI